MLKIPVTFSKTKARGFKTCRTRLYCKNRLAFRPAFFFPKSNRIGRAALPKPHRGGFSPAHPEAFARKVPGYRSLSFAHRVIERIGCGNIPLDLVCRKNAKFRQPGKPIAQTAHAGQINLKHCICPYPSFLPNLSMRPKKTPIFSAVKPGHMHGSPPFFIRFAQPIKELIFYKYIAQAHQHQAKMKTGKNHSAWQGLLLNGALHENIVDMLSCPVGIEQLGKYFWRVSQVLNAPLQDMACGVLLARTTGAPEWNTCLQNFSHSERIEAKIDFPLKKRIRKSRKIRKRLPDFPIEQPPSPSARRGLPPALAEKWASRRPPFYGSAPHASKKIETLWR